MSNSSAARRTALLSLLAIAGVATACVAYSRLENQRQNAVAAQHEMTACLADLKDLSIWQTGGAQPAAPADANDPELNRRLHTAASVAQIPDQLVSIDPGQPRRVRDTDYTETFVGLRLNRVTMRQLVSFLHYLSAHDASVRARSIELAPPGAAESAGAPLQAASKGPAEYWTADVMLAYLSYAPRKGSGS